MTGSSYANANTHSKDDHMKWLAEIDKFNNAQYVLQYNSI